MEHNSWPPLKVLEKLFQSFTMIFQKICQNGGKNSQHKYFYHDWKTLNPSFWKQKKFYFYLLKIRRYCYSNWKTYFSQIWRYHFGDPRGESFSYDFFPGKIICVKRPQLSETSTIRAITPGSWPRGGCRLWTPVCN